MHTALFFQNGEADLMFLDGGDIYRSEEFLSVVAAEDYGEGGMNKSGKSRSN